jgi:hypothetical protein
MTSPPDVQQVIEAMRSKEYRVFENPSGHDLNLVGIRTVDTTANSFNDWITVFYMFDGVWNHFAFPGTTDPGLYYRENPANVRGTAIMKPGQYRGAYMIGLHRGYKALQQKGPITVFRDRDGDEELDTSGSEEHTGIHAVNIHRANSYRASMEVGKWSAGCQVFQDPDHFLFLLSLCEKAREKFGNSFTYTLLEEGDLP